MRLKERTKDVPLADPKAYSVVWTTAASMAASKVVMMVTLSVTLMVGQLADV